MLPELKEDPAVNTTYVIHKTFDSGPRLNVKIEKNTKGFNYEATVTGAKTVEEAMHILETAEQQLRQKYGTPDEHI